MGQRGSIDGLVYGDEQYLDDSQTQSIRRIGHGWIYTHRKHARTPGLLFIPDPYTPPPEKPEQLKERGLIDYEVMNEESQSDFLYRAIAIVEMYAHEQLARMLEFKEEKIGGSLTRFENMENAKEGIRCLRIVAAHLRKQEEELKRAHAQHLTS